MHYNLLGGRDAVPISLGAWSFELLVEVTQLTGWRQGK